MGSKRRRWAVGCAGTALVAALTLALAAWWAKDLPRREIERILSARTGARISLGALVLEGRRAFVLRDVVVTRYPGIDLLDRVAIERLRVTGDPFEIAAGRVDTLEIEGLEIRLARGAAPPALPPSAPPKIAALTLERGELVVAAAGSETRFAFAAEIDDVGTSPHGTVSASLRSGPLAPVVALAFGDAVLAEVRARAGNVLQSSCPGWSVSGELLPDGSLRARSGPSCALTAEPAGRTAVTLPMPAWRAELAPPEASGARRFEAEIEIGDLAAGVASGRYDPAEDAPLVESAHVRTDRLGACLAIAGALPESTGVDGTLEIDVRGAPAGRLAVEMHGQLPRVWWSADGARIEASDVEVRVRADVGPSNPRAGGPIRGLLVARRVSGTVAGRRVPASLGRVALDVDGEVSAVGAPTLRGRAELRTAAFSAAARGAVSAGSDGPSTDLRWEVPARAISDLLRLAVEAGVLEAGAIPDFGGTVSASGVVQGPLANPRVRADVDARQITVEADEVTVGDAWVRAQLAARGGAAAVEAEHLEARATLQWSGLAPRELRAAGRGSLAIASGEARLEIDEIAVDGLATAAARVTVHPDADPIASATLESRVVDLPEILRWVEPRFGAPLPGYRIAGLPTLTFAVEARRDGSWRAEGPVAIDRTEIGSEDGSRVIQGPGVRLDVRGEGSPTGALMVNARGTAGGFVLLWDEWFADYGSLTSEVEAGFRLVPAQSTGEGGDWTATARVALPDGTVFEGDAHGAADATTQWSAAVRAIDLERTFRERVRGPLGDSLTVLSKMNLAGALDGEAKGTIRKDGAWSASGGLRLEHLWVVDDAGFVAVDDLDLDLPFDVQVTPEGVRSGARREGRLDFDRMQIAGIPIRGTSTSVATAGDGLELLEPLSVALLGGTVTLRAFAVRELLGDDRRLETAVGVEGIRLERLSEALGVLPLEGEVAGAFPRVIVTPETLTVEGGGAIEVFGGRVEIGGISGTEVLSEYPRVTLSASFRDLDLAEITRTFDFGIMTGIVEGEVRDCELFRGVPLEFEARVETVKRKGISQTITVKAINNLAILGTGGRITAFDRGFQRLIDRYNYAKLGIHASLHEDRFVLRGTAGKPGKEKFLAGKLPFRIDIVNVRPGTPVSFRSMLERLRDLDVSTIRLEPD